MNKASKIIYNIADYNTREEFIEAVLKQIKVFIESHKVFSFHENPKIKGIYALQFGPCEMGPDDSWPVWLTGDEILNATAYASQCEYARAKQYIEDYEDEDWEQNVEEEKKSDA